MICLNFSKNCLNTLLVKKFQFYFYLTSKKISISCNACFVFKRFRVRRKSIVRFISVITPQTNCGFSVNFTVLTLWMPRAYIYVLQWSYLWPQMFFTNNHGRNIRPGVLVWNTVKIASQQPKAYIYVLDECSEQPKAYIYVPITKFCLCLWMFDLNHIGCF